MWESRPGQFEDRAGKLFWPGMACLMVISIYSCKSLLRDSSWHKWVCQFPVAALSNLHIQHGIGVKLKSKAIIDTTRNP